MIKNNNFINILSGEETYPFRYSICTLASRPDEYQEMVASFIAAGFTPDICEYLCIDNSKKNTYDAFAGFNRFLREAKSEYIIVCHQDILLNEHKIADLDLRINEIESIDPTWGVLSNAGGINLKYVGMHLTQNCGNRLKEDRLPLRVRTVDENFIVVKNSCNLALSADLSGFHMYGTDICLIAETLGFNAYLIDFRLTHKSNGNVDHHFYSIRRQLMNKYRKAFRGRFMSTTITRFYISGNSMGFSLLNTGLVMFLVRQYYKLFKHKKGYQAKYPAE